MPTVRAFTSADIVAALLGGDIDYRISHAYFLFENTAGSPTPLVPAQSDTASTFHALTAPQDFVRVPLLASPVFEATSGGYNGNRLTFTSIGSGLTGVVNSLPFDAANNSQVFGVALVASPGPTYASDVLYSHTDLPTPLPVLAAGQIGGTHPIEIS